jgi:prepilin-type processing-associated H-X9-DG protein
LTLRRIPTLGYTRAGLSLLEVLVVVAIVVLLVGITFSAVQRTRDMAARTACQSNLRQLALATHMYTESKGHLPKGCDYPFLTASSGESSQCGISWHTSILPFLEQNRLWQMAWGANRADPGGNSNAHDEVERQWVAVLSCPSDSRRLGGLRPEVQWALTSYRGVCGTRHGSADGVLLDAYTVRFADITDGSSNTLMIGERPPGPGGIYGGWYARWGDSRCVVGQLLPVGRDTWFPTGNIGCPPAVTAFRPGREDNPCDVNHYWSVHMGGANFAFADASVRLVRYSADPIIPALATRAGGEVVTLPE